MKAPHFGWTKTGKAVHQHVLDHHPTATRYQRFNKRVALLITKNVGTMTCFWLFTVLALCSLPASLKLAGIITIGWLPASVLTIGFMYLISWIAQSYIQLVLLPALMVGQNLQNEASDARSAKAFEDTEVIVDRLDVNTEGGIKTVLDTIADLKASGCKCTPVKQTRKPSTGPRAK